MMTAKDLAQHALNMLKQIDRLEPIEKARVMRIAVALLTEVLQQPIPVRDE